MSYNLLKGKRGIIFGALNEQSIAWKVAEKAVEEGAVITLSNTPVAVRKAKAAIKKAFQNTLDKKGTSVVEIVSTCNSGWKMSPVDANKWMEENMFANYPMGDLKNE